MVSPDGGRTYISKLRRVLPVTPSYDMKTAFVSVDRIGGVYLVFRELYQIFR